MRKPRVLILTGPTCIGKTAISIELARQLNGEVISADSVQVYRTLDIGSSKISESERNGIRHHLIDICDPTEEFSCGRFFREARSATEDILSRGKVPIVVGGTGFYLKWFVHGSAKTGKSTSETRKKAVLYLNGVWEDAKRTKGMDLTETEKWDIGIQALKTAGDPEAAQRIAEERNNYYRLTRAVEIVLNHETAMSELSIDTQKCLDYDFRCFFLHRPRIEIYHRIEQRCENMIRGGLLREAKALLDHGLEPNTNCATRAIGYRQSMTFLKKLQMNELQLTDDVLVQFFTQFKSATRKLVKQQITWFRSEPMYTWIDLSSKEMEPKTQILKKWKKLSFRSFEVEKGLLSKTDENDLKCYIPQMHYYGNPIHRNQLVEQIRDLLHLERNVRHSVP